MTTLNRFVEENIPMHMFGIGFTVFLFAQNIIMAGGTILASIGMPDDEDIEGLKKTEVWRIVIGFPIIFCIMSIILVSFMMKYESPKYLIALGEPDSHILKSIAMIYSPDENHYKILEFIKKSVSSETDTISFK